MKALLLIASLCLGAAPVLARDDSPNIEAVWLPQIVTFMYQADNTFYSCSSLWEKVAGILTHLGARRTAPVQRIGCDDFAHTVRLQIALESPVEATPAICPYDRLRHGRHAGRASAGQAAAERE